MTEIAQTDIPVDGRWSGNLLDLPDFFSAKGSQAIHGALNLVHRDAAMDGLSSSMHNRGLGVVHSMVANLT